MAKSNQNNLNNAIFFLFGIIALLVVILFFGPIKSDSTKMKEIKTTTSEIEKILNKLEPEISKRDRLIKENSDNIIPRIETKLNDLSVKITKQDQENLQDIAKDINDIQQDVKQVTLILLIEPTSDLKESSQQLKSKITKLNSQIEALEKLELETIDIKKIQAFVQILWPIIVLVIVWSLLTSEIALIRIKKLLSPFKSFKFFGGEIILASLSSEEKRTLIIEAEETFKSYRNQIKREYDRQIDNKEVGKYFGKFLENLYPQNLRPKDFRATIHVPDALFTETLYQLLDYYPGNNGTRGRTLSIRYGIIGRAWRLKSYWIDQNVSSMPQELTKNWGMTFEEAVRFKDSNRKSSACFLLRDTSVNPENNLALLYIDSTDINGFQALINLYRGSGPPHTTDLKLVQQEIDKIANDNGLIKAISETLSEVRDASPLIRIYNLNDD